MQGSRESATSQFTEKFIAFMDVLGFSKLVESAEVGDDMQLEELVELLKCLGSPEDQDRFSKHGPTICPQSTYRRRDLDFRVTQVSDCVVVSSEISPAGIINLVNHCWVAVIRLLQAGIMCRGYITRGSIFHTDTYLIGTGYQQAYQKERNVTAFKREADERGTPFVEVDKAVCDYVSGCGNACVKEMFGRSVKADGDVIALFPFRRLGHRFVIGGHHPFDAEKERRSNENVRHMINRLKDRVLSFVDPSNRDAGNKAEHYARSLNAQLDECDRTDDLIRRLHSKPGEVGNQSLP